MKRNLTSLAACALAIGLIAAGCGSSNDNSTSTSSLTKAQWIAKADAICQQGNQEINTAGKQLFGNQQAPPSQADQEKFASDTLVPNIQKQIDDIRALGAPSGDEDQVNAILDAAQKGVDQAKANPSLLTEQGSGQDPFAGANKLATQYGMKVCGQD